MASMDSNHLGRTPPPFVPSDHPGKKVEVEPPPLPNEPASSQPSVPPQPPVFRSPQQVDAPAGESSRLAQPILGSVPDTGLSLNVDPFAHPTASVTPTAGPMLEPSAAVFALPADAKKEVSLGSLEEVHTDVELAEESLTHALLKSSPPYLASCIANMVLMIVFGMLHFLVPEKPGGFTVELSISEEEVFEERAETLEFDLAPELPDETEVEPAAAAPDEMVEEVSLEQPMPSPQPFVFPDSSPTPIEHAVDRKAFWKPGKRSIWDGRGKDAKKNLMPIYGGSRVTENAVQLGLKWLGRQQRRTGEWSLRGNFANKGREDDINAATALALLAFQGNGYTPFQGEKVSYRNRVLRGWQALFRRQGPSGGFTKGSSANHQFYAHSLCTLALCELYGMSKKSLYHDRAQKAVDYLVLAQSTSGGWRYGFRGSRGTDSDLSVSGWAIMALQSARMAGLKVPDQTFANFNGFLDSVASDSGSQYSYRPRSSSTITMTAEGLLCRQFLGWNRTDSAMIRGADHLLQMPIDYKQGSNVYYWYYATQVLHNMEGKSWKKWNDVMSVEVPMHQEKKGKEIGSWHPGVRYSDTVGGRLYSTCLSIYMLEIYYRHLPIYGRHLKGRKKSPQVIATKKPEEIEEVSEEILKELYGD